MTEPQESVALERRPIQVPIALISDDEVRRLYRVAEALALSRMFQDVTKAEQAFAKMIIGRDLGMSPAQSMLGLHLVEGSVMVHYAMLGRFVRARADEGYDYRSGWIKRATYATVIHADADAEPRTGWIIGEEQNENVGRVWVVKFRSGHTARLNDNEVTIEQRTELVWMDEDDPTDDRPIFGATVEFSVWDNVVGVSTFTVEDAQKAGLIKDSAKAAWKTVPRNMLLARAMSNGVKWFVPEVMGGLPIYVDGEITPGMGKDSITEPVGSGDDAGSGVELGPKVEAVIKRAGELGHAGLSNRATIELAVGNRAPSVVGDWIVRANKELDSFDAEQHGGWRCDACGSAVPGENPPSQCRYCDVGPDGAWTGVAPQGITDAQVVEDKPLADEKPLSAEQPLAEQVQEDRVVQDMQTEVLRHRLKNLEAARAEEQDPEQKSLIDEEIAHVRNQLGEDGAEQ